MAGGKWEVANKTLPGLYSKVISISPTLPMIGERGVVAMPIALSWGEPLSEVTALEMTTGESLSKIGIDASDPKAKLIMEALRYCRKAYIYNSSTGGEKATATVGDITVNAKYPGTFGNRITISIVQDAARKTKYNVITQIDNIKHEVQTISEISELKDNDVVTFTFDAESDTLAANAGVTLAGGTDGTQASSFYTNFLNAIKRKKWNVLAALNAQSQDNTNVITFIKNLRDECGMHVQAVLHNVDSVDYEGIIVTKQGYKTKDLEIKPEEFPATVAGLTAGASMTQSNTMKKIDGAIEIIGELSTEELNEAIAKGFFTLSYNVDEDVVCTQDINTFISFEPSKSKAFSKNRVLRVIDNIIMDSRSDFEKNYAGKMSNNQRDRDLYKGSRITYLQQLVEAGALNPFNNDDITVEPGDDTDSIYLTMVIQPVDSVEKIYLTIRVM